MSRLQAVFAARGAARQKVLVAYLCVGDPSVDESVELAVAAIEAGADVLELGVPFSDATADGPAIARAAQRAIRGGSTLTAALDVARRVRARVAAPLVLFTYYNPILVGGEDAVVRRAADAGVDALLVVDLPPEESGPLRLAAAAAGLGVVPLVAPTSDAARIDRILAAEVDGAAPSFLYYVSLTGVTGSAAPELGRASTAAEALRQRSGRPVVVGFGIDSGAAARAAAGAPGGGADGVVVGTALVKRVEAGRTPAERAASVRAFVGELRAALDETAAVAAPV